MRFARGDDRGFVMSLFRDWVCGVSIGYALGGEVLWLVGEVGAIGTSRNFLVHVCHLVACGCPMLYVVWA